MDGFKSPAVDFTLVMSLMLLFLAQSPNAQIMFNPALPQDVPYCEEQVPTMLTATCQYSGNSGIAPNWLVTGLATMPDQIIPNQMPSPFMTQGGSTESTLTVNSQEITSTTCFRCEFTTGDGPVQSRQGCVDAVGPPMAPNNVVMNGSKITWSPSAPDLSHRASVCIEGTSDCPFQDSCIGCNSLSVTGSMESCSYNITVCSSNVVNGVPCVRGSCTSITASLDTTHPSVPSPTPLISGAAAGVIAGVAAGCLVFSVATGVITFLCTRRCYNKKSSPPPPNEKSVYYETVQSDNVQMQSSPAYVSIEGAK